MAWFSPSSPPGLTLKHHSGVILWVAYAVTPIGLSGDGRDFRIRHGLITLLSRNATLRRHDTLQHRPPDGQADAIDNGSHERAQEIFPRTLVAIKTAVGDCPPLFECSTSEWTRQTLYKGNNDGA